MSLSPKIRVSLWLVLLLALLFIYSVASPAQDEQSAGLSAKDRALDYPRGPWWRADLNRTVLGVAHILIAHRDSSEKASLLKIPKGDLPGRSRAEALALARDTLLKLRRDPSGFEQLARQVSDDALSGPLGGILGSVRVPHLPVAFVDAIGNLEVGEVSRIVETPLGFHLVKRLAAAAPEWLSGQRIVIGHREAYPVMRSGALPQRDRGQARALAERVAAEARISGADFTSLVARYSDSVDALEEGRYGPFHAYEGHPTLLFVLSTLRADEVSDLLETPEGFMIVKRIRATKPRLAAATMFAVGFASPFVPAQLRVTRSREDARAVAVSIARQLGNDPSLFDRLRNEHCDYQFCEMGTITIRRGNASYPGLVDALQEVAVGSTLGPLERPEGFLFARRAPDPEAAPEPLAYATELPRPPALELGTATKQQMLLYTEALRNAGKEQLDMDEGERAHYDDLFDQLVMAYSEAEPTEWEEVTAAATQELAIFLGPQRSALLSRIHEQMLAHLSGRLDEP